MIVSGSSRTLEEDEVRGPGWNRRAKLQDLAHSVNRPFAAVRLCYPPAKADELPVCCNPAAGSGEKPMTVNSPTPKKSTLDTVANIAIIVVCVIAAGVLGLRLYDRFHAPAGPPQVEKGEQYDQLKQVVPAGASRALVVAVQPGCHFCNDSLPFYKKLIDQRNQQSSQVKFVAAVPSEEAKPQESQKFSTAGAQPDSVVKLDFAAVKVPGTPTLMLVDNNGKVLDVWVGKLDSGGEKEVLKVL
jgi:thioredoxin-related protein